MTELDEKTFDAMSETSWIMFTYELEFDEALSLYVSNDEQQND